MQYQSHCMPSLNLLEKLVHSFQSRKSWSVKTAQKKLKKAEEKVIKSETTTEPKVLWQIGAPDDEDDFLQQVAKESLILRGDDAIALSAQLPPRATGFPWKLVYSTHTHGTSLSTLIRKLTKETAPSSPIILLIEDLEGHVFGSYMSCAWKISDHFHGDSSTFVFKGGPEEFTSFKWSGHKHAYFLQAKEDFVTIGASNGKYALWLDNCLDKGRTEECKTFGSTPLTPNKDFSVKYLECWALDDLLL
ncbi:oxidation resistance protein 1 isoform X2 [Folsomia candida]|uniref:oxidation resistance protein 1 isoform X2 n=1 Tax=Folsomia candida TaxID=158441 RepID=UPI000B8F9545|nr:oxidation resistance protein 1 isoform X2 [Folsomia candida]